MAPNRRLAKLPPVQSFQNVDACRLDGGRESEQNAHQHGNQKRVPGFDSAVNRLSAYVLKITRLFVRFQKKMRLVSLEIPEPGATRYRNLVRPNPKLSRSRATKCTLSPKCRTISWKAARTSGVGSRGGDRCREARESGVKLCAGCDDRPFVQNASSVRQGDYTAM
jgi:hypothetical protein